MRRFRMHAPPWPAAIALLGLLTASAGRAQAPLPGGYLDLSTTPRAHQAAPGPLHLRGPHRIHVVPAAGADLQVALRHVRIGNYTDSVTYRVADRHGTQLAAGRVRPGRTGLVTVAAPPDGASLLDVDTHLNAISIETADARFAIEAGATRPLHAIRTSTPLYVWVPAGARTFTVTLKGQHPREHAKLTVTRPDGRTAASISTVGTEHTRAQATVTVADGLAGAVWSLRCNPVAGETFEDYSIALSGDVIPAVCPVPGLLAVPLLSLNLVPAAGGAEARCRLAVDPEAVGRHRLRLRVRGPHGSLLDETGLLTLTEPTHVLPINGKGLIRAAAEAELLTPDGKVSARATAHAAIAHGRVFVERTHTENHAPAARTEEDRRRGFQVFARPEPGDIRPTSRPRPTDIVFRLDAATCPGEMTTAFLTLYPLESRQEARLAARPEAGTGPTPDPGWLTFHRVVYRPQRTGWRDMTFRDIPECLTPLGDVELRPREPILIGVRMRLPAETPPGRYQTGLWLEDAERSTFVCALSLTVHPFRLAKAGGRALWGLYPDSSRWAAYSDADLRRELTRIRAHGITTLMLYPLQAGTWTYNGTELAADLTEFRRRMDASREAGFLGPYVISIQGGEDLIRQLTGIDDPDSDAFARAYNRMLAILRRESLSRDWPEHLLHSVDEPSERRHAEAAKRTLGRIKAAGFRTFNTCYGSFARDVLDPVLDVRCYNNIGFLSMPSSDAAATLRKETLEAGDTFWWYGTGCYTNRGLIQDGNITVNRFMAGVHFWRTGATACWSWTFLRPKGSAYDDFDGGGRREEKDACIVYPDPEANGFVSTLQWEGLHEGILDYRYLLTLDRAVARGLADNDPERVRRATRIRQRRDTLLENLPWTCADGAVTNGDLTSLRRELAGLIISLRPDPR